MSASSHDPRSASDLRMVLDKAAGSCWEMVVRYGVGSEELGRDALPSLRGRAHAVASAFGIFAGRNRLSRRRLRSPLKSLAGRRLGRADLVSIDELAALAHLPVDQSIPELSRAGARPVPPPSAVAAQGKVHKVGER